MRFRCTNTCFYKGQLHTAGGAGIEWEGEVVKCPECKGTGCRKCGGTGRIHPPHHFTPEGEIAAPVANMNEIETLRNELTEMGVPFDRRWGVSKLKGEMMAAKKDGIKREKSDAVG